MNSRRAEKWQLDFNSSIHGAILWEGECKKYVVNDKILNSINVEES